MRRIVEYAVLRKIDVLTVYAFSSENWQRPSSEVEMLLQLFINSLDAELDNLCKQRVCLRFIGERQAFPESLQQAMNDAEAATDGNTELRLNVAVNYGGRWDVIQACQSLLRCYLAEKRQVPDIPVLTRQLAERLTLADCVEPELFVRTGGEKRISNYLLWQLAYTELYFTDVPWPEFSTIDFDSALDWYAHRQRRFGRTAEQLHAGH